MTRKAFLKSVSDSTVFATVIVGLFALMLDYGFSVNYWMHLTTDIIYLLFGFILLLFYVKQFPQNRVFKDQPIGYYIVLSLSFILMLLSLCNISNFLFFNSVELNFYTALLVFLITIIDLSGRLYNLNKQSLHPALVFVLSFVVLICIGTLLLLAPNATSGSISFVDALFTATSAVCVTGLAVVNTGQDFTIVGQVAILCLIQLGALGMLSFTSLFGLFFKGVGSFGSRLDIKDMINAETIDGAFKHLVQIIIFVFLLESIGTVIIFNVVSGDNITFNERLFFSIFHSVSAFCNAGFSTLTDSLYEEGFRFNYSLHIIIGILIFFGGLGYGVVLNLYQYLVKFLLYFLKYLLKIELPEHITRKRPNLTLNSRIVLYTTFFLIVFGGVFFYFLELDNELKGHNGLGQIVTAVFGSITTRTAGFNTVDTGSLHYSTLIIIIFLMWIGASPGSTGGGIKTSTFAVAFFNIYQQIFGRKSITIGYRSIATKTLQRATSIISLSLLVIGSSTFLLVVFDGEVGIMESLFESVSAFSTVGLSMGVTSDFSNASKFVLIGTMFIGRVGLLTLLIGIARQLGSVTTSLIEYPEEEIFIN